MRNEVANVAELGDLEKRWMALPLQELEMLPVAVRVQIRLAEILLLLDELRAELAHDEVAQLQWTKPEIEAVSDVVESLLDDLAN